MQLDLFLPCMNCTNPVPQDKAKFFQAVFVCERCYELAEGIYRKTEKELKQVLTVFQESLRLSLLQGKLHLGTEPSAKIEGLRNLLSAVPKGDPHAGETS